MTYKTYRKETYKNSDGISVQQKQSDTETPEEHSEKLMDKVRDIPGFAKKLPPEIFYKTMYKKLRDKLLKKRCGTEGSRTITKEDIR